jgi:hypothetical protein
MNTLEVGQLCQRALKHYSTTAEYQTFLKTVSLYLIHGQDQPLQDLEQEIQKLEQEAKQPPSHVILVVKEQDCTRSRCPVYYLLHVTVAQLVKAYDPPVFFFQCGNHDHGPFRASECFMRWIEDPAEIRRMLAKDMVITKDDDNIETYLICWVEEHIPITQTEKPPLLQEAQNYWAE